VLLHHAHRALADFRGKLRRLVHGSILSRVGASSNPGAVQGGERNGGKPGRGSENKQPFVVAVATDETLEHPTFAVIEPVRSFDNPSLLDWGKRRLAPGAEVFSDGLGCFRRVVDLEHAHTVLETGGGRASTEVKGARWVNVVMANVKRAISGCYHAMRQAKYARRYLAEAAYRFNRRFRALSRFVWLTFMLPSAEPHVSTGSSAGA